MNRRLPLLALALTTCASCASIVSKSKYPVSIQSEPAGLEFEVFAPDGHSVHKGRTPQIVTLDAHKGFFQRAKYVVRSTGTPGAPLEAQLEASLDPWYIGNIIFGGLIGILIVDPLTGAMWKLPDDFVLRASNHEAAATAQTAPTPQS